MTALLAANVLGFLRVHLHRLADEDRSRVLIEFDYAGGHQFFENVSQRFPISTKQLAGDWFAEREVRPGCPE